MARYLAAREVELYFALPLGLTLDFFGEADVLSVVLPGGGLGVEVDVATGLGFHIAFVLGARFALGDGFGLLAELGYALHAFEHEVEAEVSGIVSTALAVDVEFDLGQPLVNLGVYFDL
jgi:hypothetical protein